MPPTSRRTFLAAAGLLAAPRIAAAQPPLLAYVGSYSNPQGAEGSAGHGKGIYLFAIDRDTGALTERALFPNPNNPSWLAFHPSRTHLYAANETAAFEGARSGSVSAYAIDASTGQLTLLNTVSSQGAGPAHLSVHPSGRYVLVANYAGGTVAVLPIGAQGELAPATDVHQDQGSIPSRRPTTAPPGSFAFSGHDRPHAHMIQSDPSGNFVLSADLGLDRILIWKFDAEKGRLSPNTPDSASLPAGDGPRHFVFHPNGRLLYSLQEESSTIVVFDYDHAARYPGPPPDRLHPAQSLHRDQLHFRNRHRSRRALSLCRQPPPRQHRLVCHRSLRRFDLRRGRVDPRRLPAQLHHRSLRQFPLLLQSARRCHHHLPRQPPHRRPRLYQPIHPRGHARPGPVPEFLSRPVRRRAYP